MAAIQLVVSKEEKKKARMENPTMDDITCKYTGYCTVELYFITALRVQPLYN